jgi:hypothetical protein
LDYWEMQEERQALDNVEFLPRESMPVERKISSNGGVDQFREQGSP